MVNRELLEELGNIATQPLDAQVSLRVPKPLLERMKKSAKQANVSRNTWIVLTLMRGEKKDKL